MEEISKGDVRHVQPEDNLYIKQEVNEDGKIEEYENLDLIKEQNLHVKEEKQENIDIKTEATFYPCDNVKIETKENMIKEVSLNLNTHIFKHFNIMY